MLKTAIIGAMAAIGAFAAVLVGGRTSSTAAEEIRCRVNVEALAADLAALRAPNADDLRRLIQKNP